MIAIDTNVLLYLVDANDPAKQQRAIDLVGRLADDDEQTVLLWQVAAEFAAGLYRWERSGRLTSEQRSEHLRMLEGVWQLVFPRTNLISATHSLVSSHSLSFWDALLLAAALEAGVTTIYSEDFAHQRVYESITVLNPFV